MTASLDPVSPPLGRVLLVGFMGAGKSEVGSALARHLGWWFRDFDTEIERRLGLSVERIFREHGEAAFRRLEGRVASELLGMDRAVLASGGGWPVPEGRMEHLGARTLSVWLRVTPEEAVERCRRQGHSRPLLESERPVEAARALLESRIGRYGKAHWTIDTAGVDAETIAARLAHRIQTDRERPIRE